MTEGAQPKFFGLTSKIVLLGTAIRPELPALAEHDEIWAVEPDPGRLENLREALRDHPNAHFLAGFPSIVEGSVELQEYNLSKFNTPSAPKNLAEFYPSIRAIGQTQVQRLAVGTLPPFLSGHGESTTIVIGNYGETSDLLEHLLADPVCSSVAKILVPVTGFELFEGDLTVEQLRAIAPENGQIHDPPPGDDHLYSLATLALREASTRHPNPGAGQSDAESSQRTGAESESAPSEAGNSLAGKQGQRPPALADNSLSPAFDDAALSLQSELSELRSDKAKANRRLGSAKAQNTKLKKRLSQTHDELQAQKTLGRQLESDREELSQALAEARRELGTVEAERIELEDALKAQKSVSERLEDELTDERKQSEQKLAAALTQLESRDAEIGVLGQQQAASAEELDASLKSLASLQSERQALQAELTKIRAEHSKVVTGLQGEIADFRNDIRTRQDSLDIAVRMQSMAEADLKNLQAQFEELSKSKAKSDELLAELIYRLQLEVGRDHALEQESQIALAEFTDASET